MKLNLQLYNCIHQYDYELPSGDTVKVVDVYPFFAHRHPTKPDVIDYFDLEVRESDLVSVRHEQEVDVLPPTEE